MHEPVAAIAARWPERLAVSCAGESLSYGELDARSSRLAALLRRAGIGPERLVAVAVERSPRLLVALLGVLKAGGAYLPLYPRERIAYVLDAGAVSLLLTESGLRAALPAPGTAGGGGPRVLELDRLDLGAPEPAAGAAERHFAGSPAHGTAMGPYPGAVFVFTRNGSIWTETQMLEATPPLPAGDSARATQSTAIR